MTESRWYFIIVNMCGIDVETHYARYGVAEHAVLFIG